MRLRSGKTLAEMLRPKNISLPRNNPSYNEKPGESMTGNIVTSTSVEEIPIVIDCITGSYGNVTTSNKYACYPRATQNMI